MTKTRLTRRTLLGSIFGFIFGFPAGAQDRDRGIGGTGVVIQPPEDRGIGGTGVIGTIREFGSIIVNDMRIAYSQYAMLEIDGEPAPLVDMRIGQVVQVVAASTAAGLETDRITIVNEVVGPITAVKKGALTVLGQTVSTRHIGDKGWKKGRWVAVSGLRQLDGTIVASLAQFKERRPGEERVRRVVGPVTIAPDGGAQIGGLKLANLDPALAGKRVLVKVGLAKGVATALKTTIDPELSAMPGVERISIEAYVANSGAEAHLGSGLTATTTSAAGSQQTRAFVMVAVKPGGTLTATSEALAPPPAPPEPHRRPPGSAQSTKAAGSAAPENGRRHWGKRHGAQRSEFRQAPHHAPNPPPPRPEPAGRKR